MKSLYIIAGPNGAGKTTASYTILPEIFDCKEFVNADEIARGISPFNPDNVAIQAGKIMLLRIKEQLQELENKIAKGLEGAYRKMIDFKKQKNSPVIVSKDGEIIEINPEISQPDTKVV